MCKHLADGIDVGTVGYQQCSIGMAQSVESDRLRKEKQTEED